MANAQKGEVLLKAGKKSYKLVLDINALCEAESAGRTTTKAILDEMGTEESIDGVSLRTVRLLIWAGLQRHHPCTIEDAGDIMVTSGILPARVAVMEAFAAAFSLNKADAEADPQPAASGNGLVG